MHMSDPEASNSEPSTPTILSHLHTLLHTHQLTYPNPTLHYLHAYAPSPASGWKGKGREIPLSDARQLELLKHIHQTAEVAKGVLARSGGKEEDRERVKLARALKEVVTHQSCLLPVSSSLSSLPASRSSNPLLISRLVLLSPIELLTALAQSLAIQTYLEDSQFGLLKTSLALAGNRFVVDVDVETDAIGNEDDEEDVDVEKRMEGRGRVRLSKLTANHVGPTGGTGKSDWVATALRSRLEGYIEAWNEGDRGRRSEGLIRALEGELRDLKGMDDLVVELGEGQVPDYFADLEEVARRVEGSTLLYHEQSGNVFPSFRVLHSTAHLLHPVFQLRPSRQAETVPIPSVPSEDMVVDQKPWVSGSWVLEYAGPANGQAGVQAGLPVRRTWLSRPTPGGEVEHGTWDPVVKVEQLLYDRRSTTQDVSSSTSPNMPAFPYTSDFIARPPAAKGEPASLMQRWSMAQPGPEGFVVARVGVPSTWAAVERLVGAIRDQAVLNQLFCSVFRSDMLDPGDHGEDGGDSDDESMADLDDLMGEPTAVPLTVTLRQQSIRITLPLPHDKEAQAQTLALDIRPSASPLNFTEITWEMASGERSLLQQEDKVNMAIEQAREGGRDMVQIIRRFQQALR